MKKVSIIGSGFSGLSAACYLAQAGHEVTVYEKQEAPGGRCRRMYKSGFLFDMGPTWYWMPDVLEQFFRDFGKTSADYFSLVKVDPSYRVFFKQDTFWDVPPGTKNFAAFAEKVEPGSGKKVTRFLEEAKEKYEKAMHQLVYKPSLSWTEYADISLLPMLFRFEVFSNIEAHVRKVVKNPMLQQCLLFPVLFLGGKPNAIPALYSLMNYADIELGTWYPMGGMYKVVEAMFQLAQELGVKFHFSSEIEGFTYEAKRITGIKVDAQTYKTDIVLSGADYQHTEQALLEEKYRQYHPSYWDKRVMAPSALIFYLGINKTTSKLLHHNLFFDTSFEQHAGEIYDHPQWPEQPLFYVSIPSRTDPAVAPAGHEAWYILVPVAAGLEGDDAIIRKKYLDQVLDRVEKQTGENIRNAIIVSENYGISDFAADYHAFKGNAYGLANTLKQTAILKPKMKNPKLENMYYTGQLTVPGPGIPPSLISGKIAATLITKENNA